MCPYTKASCDTRKTTDEESKEDQTGYTTFYTLVINDEIHEVSDGRREGILAWLERDENFRNELEDFHESGMNGHSKWYEHDEDMLRLSEAFPEVLFVLWGRGQGTRRPMEVLLPRRLGARGPGSRRVPIL